MQKRGMLTLLLHGFGHSIGHINKVVKIEFETWTWGFEVLCIEELDEDLLTLEFRRLVNAGIITKIQKLVSLALVVMLEYSDHGRR
jgi:hypothetical protein